MRLTHLKLAGFKSFVDPATLHLHGQRVGIVGPNGCGKSNVIEAVRWVLGESSARELRGDSMRDVIFNGSANRKPVSRASVELHFDNSLGGAPGQWSEYAEIAVKRVLERDGSSSYIINNTQVRRRDVMDLFLGTGVGSRAYGIIGQNTISRIVEARPEELRTFLEEAAGVSKYKERRHETELRLRDTRENLTRVDDIRRELGHQIGHLEAQAEVATHYHKLKHELDLINQLLWLLKKRQAAGDWEKARKRVEGLVNTLDAEMAMLRKTEAGLEQMRLQHAGASAVLQQAQGAFYEASAELSGIEQQLKHARETMERSNARQRELSAQRQRIDSQLSECVALLADQKSLLVNAEAGSVVAIEALEKSRQALPEHEMKCRESRQELDSALADLGRTEQSLQLILADLSHQRRQIEQQQLRRKRLQEERDALVPPDMAAIAEHEQRQQQAQRQLAALEAEIAALQESESAGHEALHHTQQNLNEEARRIAQLEAQFAALYKIQQAIGGGEKLSEWLSSNALERKTRFWQSVRVEPGWDAVLEHALGERLNALVMDTLDVAGQMEAPPAPLVLCAPAAGEARKPDRLGLKPLLHMIEPHSPAMAAVVGDWLAGVYVASSYAQALSMRGELADGEMIACPQGHLVSRTSVRMYAPGSALHGVLERQRELDTLDQALPSAKSTLGALEAALKAQQESLAEIRRRLAEQRHIHKQLDSRHHEMTLEVQKLRQHRQHVEARMHQITLEMNELGSHIADGEQQLQAGESARMGNESRLPQLRHRCDEIRLVLAGCESALTRAREAAQGADRAVQEAQFNTKSISYRIIEIDNSIKVFSENMSDIERQIAEMQGVLDNHGLDTLQAALHGAIETRQMRETAIATARNSLAGLEAQLSEAERSRMQSEQNLHPLRDRLEQARLQEQEVRLHFEHCAQQLSGANEGALEALAQKSARPAEMERKAENLQNEIAALGAVNLAAIDQLNSERERASYLDSQAQDLGAAIETLEEAIRRIDKETRGRLQHTYDEVNKNFSELFTTLFDGGQARLELLGEEILDTGIQVFAQPPGKKNSTIQLLSGGEKAMAAIALIFAMFRLNPAPFCLMDEVDAPLDESNTERFCAMVKKMSQHTQFVFISHNKTAMEMAQQLIGVTMQESGVSRVVEVDVEEALRMTEEMA